MLWLVLLLNYTDSCSQFRLSKLNFTRTKWLSLMQNASLIEKHQIEKLYFLRQSLTRVKLNFTQVKFLEHVFFHPKPFFILLVSKWDLHMHTDKVLWEVWVCLYLRDFSFFLGGWGEIRGCEFFFFFFVRLTGALRVIVQKTFNAPTL